MESQVARWFVVGAACLTIPLSIGATQHLEYVSTAGGAPAGGAGHVIARLANPTLPAGWQGAEPRGEDLCLGIQVAFGGGDGAPGVD